MGPVLLLDMGIIILSVGARSGKLGRARPIGKIAYQMMIEEFRAIVTIKPFDLKWKFLFNILNLLEHSMPPPCSRSLGSLSM